MTDVSELGKVRKNVLVMEGVPERYLLVLEPFVRLMVNELIANQSKGDRPGWLRMSKDEVLLELYYHTAKLQKAMKDGDLEHIKEHGADVANMALMAVDVANALWSHNGEAASSDVVRERVETERLSALPQHIRMQVIGCFCPGCAVDTRGDPCYCMRDE